MGIAAKVALSSRGAFVKNALKNTSSKNVKQKMPDFKTFFLEVSRRRGIKNPCWPEYLEALGNAMDGHGTQFACSTPPRHLKTTFILRKTLYIMLTEDGTKQIYASYADDIVRPMSNDFDADYKAWTGTELRDSVGEKRIGTNILFMRSVKGSLNGLGANRNCIIDDPFRNFQDAWSLTVRDQTYENVTSALFSRCQYGCNRIINGTRWHTDDLHGRLATPEAGWEVINYPAIKSDGQPLFPELCPMDYLMQQQKNAGGPRGVKWLSLYQGQPPNETQGFFPVKHYHKVSELGQFKLKLVVSGIDLAYTSSAHSDYCAHAIVGLTEDDKIVVLHGDMEQIATSEFFQKVKYKNAIYNVHESFWRGIKAEIDRCGSIQKEFGLSVRGLVSEGKKLSAMNCRDAWVSDSIYVPDEWDMHPGSPLHQLISFTADESRHDDFVDALCVAVDRLLDRIDAPNDFSLSSIAYERDRIYLGDR